MDLTQCDILLFDLDGTVTDSAPGVTRAFSLALESQGIQEPPENLRKVLGPPLDYSFCTLYGVPREKLDDVMEVYKSHYIPYGALYENSVYPGIPELFERLRAAGKRLVAASSKREDMVIAVMEHFGLDQYFDMMAGSDWTQGRSTKEEVLEHIIDTLPIPDLSRALMIGDRMYDVEGAARVGIPAVGVLWGYGSKEELERAGAAVTAAAPGELAALLGV